MNREYTYRLAIDQDVKHLQDLGLIAYGQFKEVLGDENWKLMEANHKNLNTYLVLLETAKCFVCVDDNKIVGMAFLIPHGNPTKVFEKEWAYIRLVGVHPKYEGQGIGRKLMEQCIDFARRSGETTLALHTSEFQDAARHIYESQGFKRIRELDLLFGKRYWLFTLDLNSKMEDVTYRKAGLADIPILIEYRTQFAIELVGEQPPELTSELKRQFEEYFIEAVSDNSCIAYIAEYAGETAGIGAMVIRRQPGNFKNPSGVSGYLMNMYTLPAYRRKGICSGLLNALVDEAKRMGITAFELHATKEGEYVYKQNGFKIHNEPTYRKYI